MKNTDLDVINKTFYPGWLMVSQLRSGQEVKDGDALYRRACQWVNTAREALSQAGFSDASVERMLYAYCALIDESVLHRDRQDDGYRKWRQDPLQARFFSTLNAGEDLWEQIRILLREPAPDSAVLTCLYRTLQLGFVGQYRAQDDERREDVVRELRARVTEKNSTRNVIRTPANNKLRMEDKRGEEHIKLSTEYGGKTQLNLGHNVDAGRSLRGEGAELRTDKWVSVRGGAGVFITADKQPSASGMMLDMSAALSQLQQAQSLAESLSSAAEVAKAELADLQTQKTLLSETLTELKKSALLMSAPAGIVQVTPKSLQLSAGENITATSGGNTDFSILKKLTVAAGERISLYAQKLGIKLLASKGKVEIQAQGDEMTLDALKDIRVSSSEGKIIISAKKEIILTSGGGYIRIADGTVECAAPDKIIERGAVWQKFGGKSISQAAQEWDSAEFAVTPKVAWPYNNAPVTGQGMKMSGDDGQSRNMKTSGSGEAQSQKSISIDVMKTYLSEER
ncbi:type VI secretion system protein TssL, short form [Cronobacter dublinensis]|nr:type VI secretion system protein TssL, short form [Cronobacter dublinensis]NCH07820.1 DUF2345 domain-containing protein [Cronobacter dublinensis]